MVPMVLAGYNAFQIGDVVVKSVAVPVVNMEPLGYGSVVMLPNGSV
jgi:hypothetical protein